MKTFNNKVAVITGAASGIGKALALELAKEGCSVALIDKSDFDEECPFSSDFSFHKFDISKIEGWEGLVNEIIERHGSVDLLINNAGISLSASLEDQEIDDIEAVIQTNLAGVIYGCKYFLPLLKKSSEAQIVNVSSLFGFTGFPNKSTYCATKFGVRGFSEALRMELYDTNISVSCVFPGPVKTPIVLNSKIFDKTKAKQEDQYLQKTGIEPARASKLIIKGIRSNSPMIFITSQTKMISFMKRIFPKLSIEIFGRFKKRLPLG